MKSVNEATDPIKALGWPTAEQIEQVIYSEYGKDGDRAVVNKTVYAHLAESVRAARQAEVVADNARSSQGPCDTRGAQAEQWPGTTEDAFARVQSALNQQPSCDRVVKVDLAALAHIRRKLNEDFTWRDKLDQIWESTRSLLTGEERDNSATLEEMIDELSKRPARLLDFDTLWEECFAIKLAHGGAFVDGNRERYEQLCAQLTGADAGGDEKSSAGKDDGSPGRVSSAACPGTSSPLAPSMDISDKAVSGMAALVNAFGDHLEKTGRVVQTASTPDCGSGDEGSSPSRPTTPEYSPIPRLSPEEVDKALAETSPLREMSYAELIRVADADSLSHHVHEAEFEIRRRAEPLTWDQVRPVIADALAKAFPDDSEESQAMGADEVWHELVKEFPDRFTEDKPDADECLHDVQEEAGQPRDRAQAGDVTAPVSSLHSDAGSGADQQAQDPGGNAEADLTNKQSSAPSSGTAGGSAEPSPGEGAGSSGCVQNKTLQQLKEDAYGEGGDPYGAIDELVERAKGVRREDLWATMRDAIGHPGFHKHSLAVTEILDAIQQNHPGVIAEGE